MWAAGPVSSLKAAGVQGAPHARSLGTHAIYTPRPPLRVWPWGLGAVQSSRSLSALCCGTSGLFSSHTVVAWAPDTDYKQSILFSTRAIKEIYNPLFSAT